jgi:hypothetical protein
MMALLVKDVEEKDYVQIPNKTARAVEVASEEEDISLEALGLITNLWSYDVTKWEVHKTELYKRFAKNKKTSVMRAWDELVQAKYIIEFKYRSGRKWEYVYIYRSKPYSDEEIEKKLLECVELAGVSSTSDFEKLKMNSSNCASQNQQIINTESTQDCIKEIQTKEIKTKEKKNIDDDEAGQFSVNDYAFREFVSRWEKLYPSIFDNDTYNAIYQKMHEFELSRFTFSEAKAQYLYMQKRTESGKLELGDYASYFVCGIKRKRKSEKSAIMQEKINQVSNMSTGSENKEDHPQNNRESNNKKELPFYNWLEE